MQEKDQEALRSHDLTNPLLESERRFQVTFEQAAVGMAHLALDGTWLLVNQWLCDFLGYTCDEFYSRTFQDMSYPDDLEANLALVARVLAGEIGTYSMEKRYIRKDGSVTWANLTVALVRDAAGQPQYFISVVEDINQRKRLEEERVDLLAREQAALQEAAARASELEAIFEAITDGVVVYDAEGHIVQTNSAAREAFALNTTSDYANLPLEDRVPLYAPCDEQGQPLPADQWPQARLLRGEVLTGVQAAEVQVQARDGRVLHMRMSGGPLRSPEGQIVGAVAVFDDVTERRQLERQTRESLNALLQMAEILVETPTEADPALAQQSVAVRLAELTRSVLGAAMIYLAQEDPETEVLHPLAALGLTPEQERQWRSNVEGSSMRERYGPAFAARLQAGETLQFDFHQPEYADLPNLAGIHRRLLVPMLTGRRVIGFLAVERYHPSLPFTLEEEVLASAVAQLLALVLERERLWREREAARGHALALREANQRMDDFMGVASHELKTPLTTIKMHAQLAARRLERLQAEPDLALEALPARIQGISDQLARSEGQITRLTRLINDLLDSSRIQAGRMDFEMQPLDLAEVVRQATEVQQQLAFFRAIHLSVPEKPVMILGDRDRLEQVVTNFLTNALKYSPPETPVEVHLAVEDGQARVWVRDQGPGIPLDSQERIWERFYRVPGVEVQSGSGIGMGLGLHISQTIIERHHGQVGVQSAPGEGATFWLRLPLIEAGYKRQDAGE